MRLSIGTKIGVGCALAVAALVIVGLASYFSVQRCLETAEQLSHTHQVSGEMPDVVVNLLNVETGQRGYTITGKQSFLESYTDGLVKTGADLQELRDLVKDDEVQRLLKTLEPLVAARLDFAKRVVNLQKNNK